MSKSNRPLKKSVRFRKKGAGAIFCRRMRLIFEVLAGGWVIVLSLFMSPDALRPSGRKPTGCMRRPPRPSPFIARATNAARWREGSKGGVVVHDGFKPYRRLDSSAQPPAHALCNAHHLHELKALIAFDGEPWVGKDAIVSATPAARSGKRAPEAKRPSHPPRSKPSTPAIGRPCAKGWPGIAPSPPRKGRTGKRPHETKRRRQSAAPPAQIQGRRAEVPRRLRGSLHQQPRPEALRMMKVKMETSGGFRTQQGAQAFAALRSVVATARKQRQNILQTLAADPQAIANAIAA